MSVSVNSRRTRLRSALAVVLTVLVVLPTAALFLRVLDEINTQRDETQLKQHGVEYLVTLAPLVSALAESQSQALQGVTAEPQSLTAAVARVQAVDERLGEELDTSSRWAGLKEKIGRLPGIAGTAQTVYDSHVEVGELALALYSAVRENAKLNMDQQSDIWFLQETITVDMPEAVTNVSRMSDSANMLAAAGQRQRAVLQVQLGVAVAAVEESVEKLTDHLQAAAEDTESSTLAGNLVSNLDSFRRGVESANRGTNYGGQPNVSTLVTAQSTLSTALNALTTVTLKELSTLLEERDDDLQIRQIEAWALLGVSIALLLVAAFWTRSRAARVRDSLDSSRNVSVRADSDGPGSSAVSPYDQAPVYGGSATGRERSGALR
ncbi:hypothetical protein GCM10010112_43460 [Actinoplanes lobatus]|uniref:Uncharacterized protein n=1 Tax=Actinoplanes lobatus TaxID=113568 RepID=A0ABQ4AH88_9ACTN|nr:hypothetical protein GCM10010112_43460 [Actinoplanes lobatus]GIE39824.1 hypothetical protein Alo02nite_27220 [Actinoplanes lobatus]